MSFLEDYNKFSGFDNLNLDEEQVKAILESLSQDSLVLAGAGSGKTRVLITRIEYLIKEMNVEPSSIMAITFTNKAAGELKDRAAKVTCDAEDMMVGTYHHICVQLLKMFGEEIGLQQFSIIDKKTAEKCAEKILVEMGCTATDQVLGTYLSRMSKLKSKLVTCKEYKTKHMNKYKGDAEKFRTDSEYEFIEFYSKYQSENLKNRVLDFDDLIMCTLILLLKSENAKNYIETTFKYIHADEVQDSNLSNILLLNELSKNCNLFMVGDLDQSIYKFRNARPEYFLNMQTEGKVKIFKLEQNYRSSKNIVDASNGIIDKNTDRIKKVCYTNKDVGEKVQCFISNDAKSEAEYVAQNILSFKMMGYDYKDFMVLYRIKAQSRAFEDEFLSMNIPYVLIGSTSFTDRKEIRDCLCFLRVAANPKDKYSFMRALRLLDGVGDATVEKIMQLFTIKGNAIDTLNHCETSRKRVRESLDFFIDLLKLSNEKPTAMLNKIAEILFEKLKAMNTDEAESKIENIEELLRLASEKEKSGMMIKEFVTQMDLLSKHDANSDTDAVQLLTVHASKGLENKIVFVVGLNEQIFPHYKSAITEEAVEEERRCMYVACTRAKELLCLTSYKHNGDKEYTSSRFIDEIPEQCIDIMRE